MYIQFRGICLNTLSDGHVFAGHSVLPLAIANTCLRRYAVPVPSGLHPFLPCSGFMATHLGSLLPPASLSSVPLLVSSMATPCVSFASAAAGVISSLVQRPQLHLSTSIANSPTVAPVSTSHNPMLQPGLILSPAADPIP